MIEIDVWIVNFKDRSLIKSTYLMKITNSSTLMINLKTKGRFVKKGQNTRTKWINNPLIYMIPPINFNLYQKGKWLN